MAPPDRRVLALAATFAIHLALVAAWQLARSQRAPDDGAVRNAIEWIEFPIAAAPRPDLREPKKKPPAPAPAARRATPVTAVAQSAPPEPATPAQEQAEAPVKSAYDMMQDAKRDVGKIDKELRKAFPERGMQAPPDSPQIRLQRGIAHAAEMAPPRWFEAPKVTEIIDPGGYGRKRYRVITANGTYCMTYDGNHAPNGIDVFKKGANQRMTNCPEHEQPPTVQK